MPEIFKIMLYVFIAIFVLAAFSLIVPPLLESYYYHKIEYFGGINVRKYHRREEFWNKVSCKIIPISLSIAVISVFFIIICSMMLCIYNNCR